MSVAKNKLVNYELRDAIATISLDDGKVNVMSRAMLAELNAAFDQALADRATARSAAEQLKTLHMPSHAVTKLRAREHTLKAVRAAIEMDAMIFESRSQ
jgi:uncharacterized protein involved in exopolysaccharide biosynthesis